MSASTTELFEPKLRWSDGPRICIYENLPAFETEKKMRYFHEINAPNKNILESWQCKVCNFWHYRAGRKGR